MDLVLWGAPCWILQADSLAGSGMRKARPHSRFAIKMAHKDLCWSETPFSPAWEREFISWACWNMFSLAAPQLRGGERPWDESICGRPCTLKGSRSGSFPKAVTRRFYLDHSLAQGNGDRPSEGLVLDFVPWPTLSIHPPRVRSRGKRSRFTEQKVSLTGFSDPKFQWIHVPSLQR